MDKITIQFILLTICLTSVDSATSKVYEANPDLYNTKSKFQTNGLSTIVQHAMCK